MKETVQKTKKTPSKAAAPELAAPKSEKTNKPSASVTKDLPAAPATTKKAKKNVSAKAAIPKAEEIAKVAAESEDEASEQELADEEEADVEEDDQTAALLQGFESSEEEDASQDEGLDANTAVPSLPDDQQLRKKLESAANQTQDAGVVYIGRVPHGFYEHQMRAYFSQFGDIKRLRLSRNRQTGASKHFAFIEFGSTEVAQIVADTMDNYLMFGHLLKVRVVPKEQVHKDLFKGAGRRFKAVPWNKIERSRLNKTDRDGWDKRTKKEAERRALKAEKLKALGYDYETSELRMVKEVPVCAIDAPQAEGVKEGVSSKLLTEAPVSETAKTDGVPVEQDTPSTEVAVAINGAVKKQKKAKQAPAVQEAKADEITTGVKAKAPKVAKVTKKAKKAKA